MHPRTAAAFALLTFLSVPLLDLEAPLLSAPADDHAVTQAAAMIESEPVEDQVIAARVNADGSMTIRCVRGADAVRNFALRQRAAATVGGGADQ